MRKQRQLWAALVAAMAMAVVVAGCGGGGDTTGGSTAAAAGSTEESGGGPALSKADFIKEADKICSEGEAAVEGELTEYVEKEGLESGKEPTEEQALEIASAVILPNLSKQAEGISALTPPEGDEGTIEDMVSSLETGVQEFEDDPEKLNEGNEALESFGEEAGDYGLKACAEEGA